MPCNQHYSRLRDLPSELPGLRKGPTMADAPANEYHYTFRIPEIEDCLAQAQKIHQIRGIVANFALSGRPLVGRIRLWDQKSSARSLEWGREIIDVYLKLRFLDTQCIKALLSNTGISEGANESAQRMLGALVRREYLAKEILRYELPSLSDRRPNYEQCLVSTLDAQSQRANEVFRWLRRHQVEMGVISFFREAAGFHYEVVEAEAMVMQEFEKQAAEMGKRVTFRKNHCVIQCRPLGIQKRLDHVGLKLSKYLQFSDIEEYRMLGESNEYRKYMAGESPGSFGVGQVLEAVFRMQGRSRACQHGSVSPRRFV